MNKILNKISDKLYLIIAFVFVSMLFMYVPFVKDIAYRATIVSLPMGAVLTILFKRKQIIKQIKNRKDSWLYLGFCVSYTLTIIVNREYNIFQNIKALVWILIYFFLFFFWQENSKKDYIHKTIIINRIFICANFILVLICDIMLWLNLNFSAEYGRPIGVDSGRLFGIFLEINSGAIVTLCSMLSAYVNVYLEKISGKKATRWHKFYVINGILCYIFLIATSSRTGLVCLCVSCVIIVCSYVYKRILFFNLPKKILVYFLVGILTLGVGYGLTFLTKEGISFQVNITQALKDKMVHIFNNQNNSTGVSDNKTDEHEIYNIVNFKRTDQAMSLSSRMIIWEQCILLWQETNPLLGIGQANMKDYSAKGEHPEHYTALTSGKYGEATHNIFVSILLFSGIIGSFLILLLWGNVFWKSILFFLRGYELQAPYVRGVYAGALCIAVSLLLYSLMCTAILFNNIFETVFFWWYFGLLSKLANEIRNPKPDGNVSL